MKSSSSGCPHHTWKRSPICPFCGKLRPTGSTPETGKIIATMRYDPVTGGLHVIKESK